MFDECVETLKPSPESGVNFQSRTSNQRAVLTSQWSTPVQQQDGRMKAGSMRASAVPQSEFDLNSPEVL